MYGLHLFSFLSASTMLSTEDDTCSIKVRLQRHCAEISWQDGQMLLRNLQQGPVAATLFTPY